MDALYKAGSSAGRLIESTLGKGTAPEDKEASDPKTITDDDRHRFYLAPKNPPVNDYHPPVVSSLPGHKDGRKWMLQPPPSAKVMEGKVPVGRSRGLSSASKTSRTTPTTAQSSYDHLGPNASRSTWRDETPSETELIDSLIGRPTPVRSLTGRSRSMSFETRSSDAEISEWKRSRRAKRTTREHRYESSDEDSDQGIALAKSLDSLGAKSARSTNGRPTARRPKLETIESSATNAKSSEGATSPKTPRRDA